MVEKHTTLKNSQNQNKANTKRG